MLSASKKIIIFAIILFIISSAFLFFIDQRSSDPNTDKNWWVVYFTDSKGNALDFTIENHSNSNNFHWEVSDGKNKLKEGDIILTKGNISKSDFDISELNSGELAGKKITVTVSDGLEKKEIYKNF